MSSQEEKGYITVIKGVAISLISIIIGILVFSIVVKNAMLGEGIIKAVNQFIKIVCIFLGCFFAVRGKLGLLKGVIIGILAIVLSHLLFALFGGSFSFGTEFWLDIAFASAIGAVSGILAVNVRK